ncbi:DUF4179 domain-containing protein [Clostridium folliculivorans]|uniref:DUF4179 domain-containing protein n=1 Tax=Clostridium folliculivorans TaxID=2886038 RepID=A0A9W5Y6V6_9CLOT|nr:DUF4179 domain-containing protein [Clostridium folliculivorans]GKU27746.1 hypothetical protein CFOLD11_45730 [Clostridium folliculivorans]GKU32546.1 hypothetical protein CFB3_46540 [Clostridium folliculivorans]
MKDNIYELLNSSSFSEEEFDNIETDLTDLEVKQLKNNFRKNIKIFNKKKFMYIVASLAIFITVGTFTVKPAFAQSFIESIPVIDSLYEKLGYYKEFKDFSSYVGLSQEKDGYKFTIDKLMADDENVMVAMRIYKSGLNTKIDEDGKLGENFMIVPYLPSSFDLFMSSDNNSKIIDDNTRLVVTTFKTVPSKRPPKRFDLSLEIHSMQDTNMNLKFTLPVSREKIIDETISKNNLGFISLNDSCKIHIDRFKMSPLGTSIKFTLPSNVNDHQNFSFYLYDDKGRIYETKSCRSQDEKNFICDFTNVEKDAKKVYIIAYKTNLLDTLNNQEKAVKYPEEMLKTYDLKTLKNFNFDGIGNINVKNIKKESSNIKFYLEINDPKNLLKHQFPIWLQNKDLYSTFTLDNFSFYKDLDSSNKNDYIAEFKNMDSNKEYRYSVNTFPYKIIAQGEPLEINLK